jgi:gamma-D-glutamyl-L-lysine dipeptidyl-peptidase
MKTCLTRAGLVLFGVAVAWFSGCRAAVGVIPPSAPPPASAPAAPSAAVTRTGYTVQVGAFSILDNARRLAQALNDIGLDAYYFPQGSGLYKVRFGDFPSRDAAVREAERLLERALVEDYFIVGPEDHPVHRRSSSGGDLREKLVATAESFIGVEYTWGGTSRREGVDCSGLVRAVYQLNGLSLPRSMTAQYHAGTTVARDRLQKGDLVFFSVSPGRPISHVGIYVGENVFIHAPGKGKKVREESLDGRYFKERFSGARTYLNVISPF